ncbi:MAG: UDP-2,3-diacylglucosamine diphosphatase [Gemmatimonadota bacterium]
MPFQQLTLLTYLRCVTHAHPVYLASDVHLGAIPLEQEQAFMAWLEHAAGKASRIVVNGDLFDFWFEYRTGPTRGYDDILGLLRTIVDGGVPITLMGGNHDWWGGSYLTDEIGVEFLRHPVVRDFAGHRTFLAHGDGLGEGDLGYRLIKPVLRGPLTRWGFWMLPPWLGDRLAGRASRTGGRWAEPNARQQERARALEAWAVEKLEGEPDLDLVVLGHAHVPGIREVEPGRWYVNAGDWVYRRTYLVLEPGRPPLLTEWEGVRT